ncbi:MAG: hypothetical protein BYD32DRAFT_431093 [Podila humilis]|nr:MAG: hypothetical protein BYD32DRAFT_431093 [Podila humilis]
MGSKFLCAAAVRIRWRPRVLGITVTGFTLNLFTLRSRATSLVSLDTGIWCFADVAIVLHVALGVHAARGIELWCEAGANTIRNKITCSRVACDGLDGRQDSCKQSDGEKLETHVWLLFV